jgi:hypothetical protein
MRRIVKLSAHLFHEGFVIIPAKKEVSEQILDMERRYLEIILHSLIAHIRVGITMKRIGEHYCLARTVWLKPAVKTKKPAAKCGPVFCLKRVSVFSFVNQCYAA